MNKTDSPGTFALSSEQAASMKRVFLLAVVAWLILLAEPAYAGVADKGKVDGYVDTDVGRTELQSCVAYPDVNRLVINLAAFEYTDADLEAYLKHGVYRDIAPGDVEGRHAIPGGYQRHPGIGIALIFDEAVSYQTAAIVDSDVGLSGTGRQGDMYTGLLGRHYDLKIVSLSKDLVAGILRSSGGRSRFQVEFRCPLVHPAR